MTETQREVSPAESLGNAQRRIAHVPISSLPPQMRADVEEAHVKLDELLRNLGVRH